MRRALVLSWPVKAVVLAVAAIGSFGGAYATPTEELFQQVSDLGGGSDWYPSGTIPAPPKPKATPGSSEDADQFGEIAFPSGTIPVPPKPKGREAGELGMDEYPAGTIPVPPKPKATPGSSEDADQFGEIAFPAGTIPVPPKPKVRETGEGGVDEYPTGTLPIPPKPKAKPGAREDADQFDDVFYPSGTIPLPPKPKVRETGESGMDEYPTGSPAIPPKPKAMPGSSEEAVSVRRWHVDTPSTGRNQAAAGTQRCGNNSPI